MQGMSLAIRVAGPPAHVESAVRREIDAMGKQAVFQMISLEGLVAKSTQNESIRDDRDRLGSFTLVLTRLGVYALIDLRSRPAPRAGDVDGTWCGWPQHSSFLLRDVAQILGMGGCPGGFQLGSHPVLSLVSLRLGRHRTNTAASGSGNPACVRTFRSARAGTTRGAA
jgi:hypothetical protein